MIAMSVPIDIRSDAFAEAAEVDPVSPEALTDGAIVVVVLVSITGPFDTVKDGLDDGILLGLLMAGVIVIGLEVGRFEGFLLGLRVGCRICASSSVGAEVVTGTRVKEGSIVGCVKRDNTVGSIDCDDGEMTMIDVG
jgi:hypothetical protein